MINTTYQSPEFGQSFDIFSGTISFPFNPSEYKIVLRFYTRSLLERTLKREMPIQSSCFSPGPSDLLKGFDNKRKQVFS